MKVEFSEFLKVWLDIGLVFCTIVIFFSPIHFALGVIVTFLMTTAIMALFLISGKSEDTNDIKN